jgi:hypothetical protein
VELKRKLYEMNLPERIVAYQTGTGWPLPEENEHCHEVGFIHYGEGPLKDYSPRGTRGIADAGMHIYTVTGEDGQKLTLLALKNRLHAYTETGSSTAPLDLAFMSRLFKGLNVEAIVTTFASGVDPTIKAESQIAIHDLAVIFDAADDSRLSATLGPGSGDQRILGDIFGGPFQNIAAMYPNKEQVSLFLQTVSEVNSEMPGTIHPQVHPAIETDTSSTPNFENPMAQALPHSAFYEVEKLQVLSEELLALFPGAPLQLIQGMAEVIERLGYFQSSEVGFKSPFNRRLPELAIATFTDKINTAVKGQSQNISDEEVRRIAKEAETVMAKIITKFFVLYAQKSA